MDEHLLSSVLAIAANGDVTRRDSIQDIGPYQHSAITLRGSLTEAQQDTVLTYPNDLFASGCGPAPQGSPYVASFAHADTLHLVGGELHISAMYDEAHIRVPLVYVKE